MILALYFGLSAVYGNGPRQETFAAHAHAGLTVLGLVVIRLFLRMLLPWPKDESGGSRILKFVAEAMHWTPCLDAADATDRLDRRLVDGMLHDRSRAAEY
jgi:cytochrome b561